MSWRIDSLPAMNSTRNNPKQYLNSTFHRRWCVHALLPLLRGCILWLDEKEKSKVLYIDKRTTPSALWGKSTLCHISKSFLISSNMRYNCNQWEIIYMFTNSTVLRDIWSYEIYLIIKLFSIAILKLLFIFQPSNFILFF